MNNSFVGGIFRVFILVFMIVLCSSLLFVGDGQMMTFSSFLDFVSSLDFDFSFVPVIDYSIGGSWRVDILGLTIIDFDWLRQFINVTISIANYACFVVKMLLQLIYFITVFFQYFFFR